MLYSTWGRKEGCELLSELKLTSEQMTEALFLAYSRAAEKSGCEVCPVGLCFGRLNSLTSAPELYTQDKSHPSAVGTSLAAIAFYKKLFGDMPKDLTALELDADEEEILLETVNEII